jgi:hypothetical protein
MARYLFAYEIKSTGKKGEFSWSANTEEDARKNVQFKVSDFEFVELEDVVVGELIKILDAKSQYYECEGCSA